MTISTTINTVTAQGNGSNKNWPFSFLIPDADSLVVTLTTIADGSTAVIDPALYSVTGLDNPAGGSVTYPLSGSPISTAFNLTVQRILPLTQETNLTNQDNFNPEVVESEFDQLVMQIQQVDQKVSQALAFPVGAADTGADELITQILNGAANATAAAASAAAAAASAASIEALIPFGTADIANAAVTSDKLGADSVLSSKLDQSAVALTAMLNGTLEASVNASALTISLKTFLGDDPSSADQILIALRSGLLTNGAYTIVAITSAMSLTVNSGATLGFSNSTAGRIWIVMFLDSGTARLGVINCRNGTDIFPLDAMGVDSSTAMSGAADNAAVFYTGSAVSNKAYTVIGYMEWSAGLVTAGTWDATPTKIQLFNAGVKLPGSIIGTRSTVTGTGSTGTTTIPADNTKPQNTEGDQYMSQAIVPTNAANVLEIAAQAMLASSANVELIAALFQDATASALAAASVNPGNNGLIVAVPLLYRTIAGQSTSTTFKVRAGGSGAGTTTFNGAGGVQRFGGVMSSYLSIKELQA